MNGEAHVRRLRSFLLGGVVGASAAMAAARRRRRKKHGPVGLAAFESAPCYQETLEKREEAAS
jgi:hypothetical protein